MELIRSSLSRKEWFKQGHYLGIKYRDERRRQLKKVIKTCILSVPYMSLLMSVLERLNVYNKVLFILFGGTYVGFLVLIIVLVIQQMLHQYVDVDVLEGYADIIDNRLVIADKSISGIPRKAMDIIRTVWSCVLCANSEEFDGVQVFNRLDCYLSNSDWSILSNIDGEYSMYVKVYKLKGDNGRFLSIDIFVSKGYTKLFKVFPNKYTR